LENTSSAAEFLRRIVTNLQERHYRLAGVIVFQRIVGQATYVVPAGGDEAAGGDAADAAEADDGDVQS